MNQHQQNWIFCGVSGSGKSTIGRLFSQARECDYQEGDRRHSAENIKKMRKGKPLDNEDRIQWLAEIQADIRWSLDRNREVVMTCSALKEKHRKELTALGRVQLVYIEVPKKILETRLLGRKDHYMSIELLDSQLLAFEEIKPEEGVITIDGSRSIDDVMKELMSKVINQFPIMEEFWWKRFVE